VQSAPLNSGEHTLTVRDTETGESSTIQININDAEERPVLATTAGGYAGTAMSSKGSDLSNLIYYYMLFVNE